MLKGVQNKHKPVLKNSAGFYFHNSFNPKTINTCVDKKVELKEISFNEQYNNYCKTNKYMYIVTNLIDKTLSLF